MAKKLTQRTLKSGEIRFYSGRKLATKEDKRHFFKSNTDLDIKGLSKEDRQFFGRIKGGLKRAKQAGTRINGKFIEGKYDRASQKLKRLGVDIDALIKIKGVKSLKELFEKEQEIKKSLEDIMSGVGLHNWYSPEDAINIIKDYLGKSIIVNGNTVDPLEAIDIISTNQAALKEYFDFFRSSIRISFVGTEKMIINTPTVDNLEYFDEDDVSEFNREYGNEENGMVQLYKSNPINGGKNN
jgi:hypothetical protein